MIGIFDRDKRAETKAVSQLIFSFIQRASLIQGKALLLAAEVQLRPCAVSQPFILVH